MALLGGAMNIRLQLGEHHIGDTEAHGYFLELSVTSPTSYYLHVWQKGQEGGGSQAGMVMIPLDQAAGMPFFAEAMQAHRVGRHTYRLALAGCPTSALANKRREHAPSAAVAATSPVTSAEGEQDLCKRATY